MRTRYLIELDPSKAFSASRTPLLLRYARKADLPPLGIVKSHPSDTVVAYRVDNVNRRTGAIEATEIDRLDSYSGLWDNVSLDSIS